MRLRRSLAAAGLLAALALPAARAQDAPAPPAAAGPSQGVSATSPHHIYLVGDLLVTEPAIVLDGQTPGQGIASFTIENRGKASDRLLTATSTAADKIVVDANGPAPGVGDGSLVIPAGKVVELRPGGVHFEFQGLHGDIRTMRFVPGLLTFERAGPLPIAFATNAAEATPAEAVDPGASAPSLAQ